jgi:transcriptional regulator with XRE-family HTH domain
LVEEAKQRRKTQRLTQARLADIAGVSTPTISRFESGEKDIQLSTVISILTVLGMNDQRTLVFTEPHPYYAPAGRKVVFTGREGDKVILCAISQAALDDYFKGNEKDPLKVFQVHHENIEHAARRKYLKEAIEANGTILLTTKDFE